jgi:hypothetical protein
MTGRRHAAGEGVTEAETGGCAEQALTTNASQTHRLM